MKPTLVWGLGKQSGSANSVAQHLIVRTSSRNGPIGVAARHHLGFDGYGMHSPLCQPPSPHHHLNAQISVKGSYGRRRQLCF